MDKYAHEDQVKLAFARLSSEVFGLLDQPGVSGELLDSVTKAVETAAERFIVYTTDNAIFNEYWAELHDD